MKMKSLRENKSGKICEEYIKGCQHKPLCKKGLGDILEKSGTGYLKTRCIDYSLCMEDLNEAINN